MPFILIGFIFLIHQKWQPQKIITNFGFLLIIIAPVSLHYYLFTDGGLGIVTKNSFNLWVNNNGFPPDNHDQGEAGSYVSKYLKNQKAFPNARPPCHTNLKKSSKV